MPRTAKKIGVAVLIGLFRGAMAAKRVLGFLFGLIAKPLGWLYFRAILPFLGFLYRFFRQGRKQVAAAVDHIRDGVLRVLANRFAIHVAIIAMSCAVAVANVSAKDTASDVTGVATQSIVDTLQGDVQQGEEFVQEDAQDTPQTIADVSYLGNSALSAQSAAQDETTYDGSDSGLELTDDEESNTDSPLANAVRVLPTFDEGQVPTRTRVEEHIVQPGETLGTIAQSYGIRVSTLTAANQIKNGYIHPGEKLRILPVDGVVYTVKKGDTLNKIAEKYNASSQDILDANGISDGAVAVGIELILPGGKIPDEPKPAPKPIPKTPSRIANSVATNIKNLIIPPPAADRKGSAKMLWPAGVHRITQYYRGRQHTGVDIAGPIGTPIYAADDGVVFKAEWNSGGYGNMTIIDHGGGVFTRYGHASKLLTKPGQVVKRGDVIALMGSTGRSTGPHLHFEVMTGDVRHRVNPLEWTK